MVHSVSYFSSFLILSTLARTLETPHIPSKAFHCTGVVLPLSMDESSVKFVHAITETGRLMPSASRWNSIEINFGLHPSSHPYDSLPSGYAKSVDFNLVVADRKIFNRFISALVFLAFLALAVLLLLNLLPHKDTHSSHLKNFTIPINQALTFFDAQKSGHLLMNNTVTFRGDSGLKDGNFGDLKVNLVGGFCDSGNNVKFGLPTTYTVTLLSWSVIEYHERYEVVGELDHVKNIIRWGSDHLLKTFKPCNSSGDPTVLYSQYQQCHRNSQRPEDMAYERHVSTCKNSSVDIAGEITAALASASMVFKEEMAYSVELIRVAEEVYAFANDMKNQGMYTMDDDCGAQARSFYNSSGYHDELVWAGTWLFFATGNASYLGDATKKFKTDVEKELTVDQGVFDWNNKLAASAVLLTRLRYLHDPGNPYEETLQLCSDKTNTLMCFYLSRHQSFQTTPGGLLMLRPLSAAPLQYAATAAFLSKLYNDYLDILKIDGGRCDNQSFSREMLQDFSTSQVEYILGKNPLKMSYLVGFGKNFPTQVHHRSASIRWDNQHYSCMQGQRWLHLVDPNPNVLIGAMVAGPDKDDKFIDKRNMPEYTEPTISGNAGLVAALISLHDYVPHPLSSSPNKLDRGIDEKGIFANIHLVPSGTMAS